MFTAKKMNEIIENSKTLKGDIVDHWLESVVLPKKLKGYTSAFDCPEGISLRELESLLKVRGFKVKTWSDYQGNFVSVDIPPQGE